MGNCIAQAGVPTSFGPSAKDQANGQNCSTDPMTGASLGCNSGPTTPQATNPAAVEQQLSPSPIPASAPSDQVTQTGVDCEADPTNAACTNTDAAGCTDPDNPTPCGGGQCCGADYTPPTQEELQQLATPTDPAQIGTPDDGTGQRVGTALNDDADPNDTEVQPTRVASGDDTSTSALSAPTASCDRSHVLQCGIRGLQTYCRCYPLARKK
jgi:hypothetical protein